jgi:hypothetical protein
MAKGDFAKGLKDFFTKGALVADGLGLTKEMAQKIDEFVKEMSEETSIRYDEGDPEEELWHKSLNWMRNRIKRFYPEYNKHDTKLTRRMALIVRDLISYRRYEIDADEVLNRAMIYLNNFISRRWSEGELHKD